MRSLTEIARLKPSCAATDVGPGRLTERAGQRRGSLDLVALRRGRAAISSPAVIPAMAGCDPTPA